MRVQHHRKTHMYMHYSPGCPIDPAGSRSTHSKTPHRTSSNSYSRRRGCFVSSSGNSPLPIKSISTRIISPRLFNRPHAEKRAAAARRKGRLESLPAVQQKCWRVVQSYLHSNSFGQQVDAVSELVHDVVPAGQDGAASAQPPSVASRGLRDCPILSAKRASLLTRLLSKRKKTASVLIVAITRNLMEGGQL
jgi:hypothetical protein